LFFQGYVNITSGSEADLQKAIAEIGPIAAALDASKSSFQLYKSGVYNDPTCSSTQVDFAGLIVGYGTKGKDDYYIFKNIWGTAWGDQGYMLMSRNKKNQCGVATMASYPIVV
jgi:cathepsin L